MLEIEGLSKETVYNVMRELLYSFNYAFFKTEEWVKSKYPEGFEEFVSLYEDFCSYQARRLSQVLDISGAGIDILIQLLKQSHWAVFENIEVEKLTDKSFKMRTTECSSQRAAKRWGAEYYDCGRIATIMRSGFFKEANPNAKVQQVFAPPEIVPEGTPGNVSCEWLISLEE